MQTIEKQISKIGQVNHLPGKFLSFDYKDTLPQLARLQTSKLQLSRTAEMNPTAGVSKLKMAYNKTHLLFNGSALPCESGVALTRPA